MFHLMSAKFHVRFPWTFKVKEEGPYNVLKNKHSSYDDNSEEENEIMIEAFSRINFGTFGK